MQNCYKEQQERLTTKHIHTLKFLQEIVAENKLLKERVDEVESQSCQCTGTNQLIEANKEKLQQIQEQYMKRADEINLMLTEKHKVEIMKKVEEQLEAEKGWSLIKQKLQTESEQQKKTIAELLRQLADGKQQKSEVDIFKLKVAALDQEIARLQEEHKKLHAKNQGQSDQLRKLEFYEDQNKCLEDELNATNQKIKELEFKIRNLERDLSYEGQTEQDEIMIALKNKLQNMHKEKLIYVEKEKDYIKLLEDLKDENEKLRRALDDSERMRMEMKSQMEQLLVELSLLRKQTTADKDRQTFKDFVQVKRELANVKEENEELKTKLKLAVSRNRELVLPSLKDTTSQGGTHARLGSAKGERRKKEMSPFGIK